MSAMASQIISLTIVYSTVYSGTDQRKHKKFASLAFVMGIHRWPANSPHKGPVTRKMFPFDDVIMKNQKVLFTNYHKRVHLALGMYLVINGQESTDDKCRFIFLCGGFNTSRRIYRHFVDDILQFISRWKFLHFYSNFTEMCFWWSNRQHLGQIMAWRSRLDNKPLFEPMMASLLTHTGACATRPVCTNKHLDRKNNIKFALPSLKPLMIVNATASSDDNIAKIPTFCCFEYQLYICRQS